MNKENIIDTIIQLNLKHISISNIEVKENYYIITIDGGYNGLNKWSEYLSQINIIMQQFKECWLIELINDCPDDIWTLKLGIRNVKSKED